MPLTNAQSARAMDRRDPDAWVYVARRASDGALKIGASTFVESRLELLAREHGEAMFLLGTQRGGFTLEAQLHRALESDRLGNTEWYRPTRRVVDLVSRILA